MLPRPMRGGSRCRPPPREFGLMKPEPLNPNQRDADPERDFREVRQIQFLMEFQRESAAGPPEIAELLTQLARSLLFAGEDPPPAPVEDAAVKYNDLMAFFLGLVCDLSTGLWRLRGKLSEAQSRHHLPEVRRAYRHMEAIWDTLEQAGVSVRDHLNESLPEGGVYSLKAVAFEPTPGLKRECVIETIKPAVYFRGQMIQMGEVIIGTPITSG